MADNTDIGPPPLEDPNSPEYVCLECQSNEDSLCAECQEMAQLRANSTRNGNSVTLDIDDESRSYVGHMILHEDPDSPVTSRSTTPQPTGAIIDSPTSTDTTLDLNDSDFVDENDVISVPGSPGPHIIHNYDETCFLFSPSYRPILKPNEESEEEM